MLGEIISARFPHALARTDWLVEDVGHGSCITVWNVDAMGEDKPGKAKIAQWLSEGMPAKPVTEADYASAVQALLDTTARERQYDSILSAISYRDDVNPAFAAEAAALAAWRSSVWTYANEELAKVQAGERPQPSVTDFVTELPEMVWP